MLYTSALPLSSVRHRDFFVETATGYGFSRSLNAVPLLAKEFPIAVAEYVIVFAVVGDTVTPAVLLGLRQDENLYLDVHDVWQAACVPAYLQRYPFIFSTVDQGKTLTLCIDAAFPGLNRQARGQPLFDAQGKPASFLENVLRSLRDDHADAKRTRAFCATLQKVGILEPIRIDMTLPAGNGVRLEGVMAVNRERLRHLPGNTLASLVRTDELELVYLHLQSMRNLGSLETRLLSRTTQASVSHPPPPGMSAAATLNAGTVRSNAAAIGEDTRTAVSRGAHMQGPGRASASKISPDASPYNREFIFRECGFDWVPEYIDRNLLFNVSYDLQTEEVKLYVLARSRDFIYKISGKAITRQYDAVLHRADTSRLSQFLGAEFDYQDLLLDTVEDDVYYLFVEDSSAPQCLKFLRAMCDKFDITERRLIAAINRINRRRIASLDECSARKAVSLVKVPFLDAGCKVYSRPFVTGNDYELSKNAIGFLTRLYDCGEESLPARLRHLWVSCELNSDRIVISTQHHDLVHAA